MPVIRLVLQCEKHVPILPPSVLFFPPHWRPGHGAPQAGAQTDRLLAGGEKFGWGKLPK